MSPSPAAPLHAAVLNPPPVTPISAHLQRRQQLAERLLPGVLVLPTAPTRTRNVDADYPYRYDSHFHYLTGFEEPEAVLVQVLGNAPRSLLFCLPKNEEREIWDGFRYGPQAACEAFGFDAAHPIEALDAQLLELLTNQPRVYFPVGADAAWDRRILGLVQRVREQSRSGTTAPEQFMDIRGTLAEMRLFKDEHELVLMRAAADISAAAHRRAMQATRPGLLEYEIEAELLHHFVKHGSRAPAYNSIVAGGRNATCLHYNQNNARLNPGELLLIDAGCEISGYAADITRTFPVSGTFSGPQRDIYQLVLAAQEASMACVRPGLPRIAYHDAAVRTLTQGLVDLGILAGSVDGLIESGAYKAYYMHGTGHWLGRDVHDVGEYRVDGEWRTLAPGMVLTVEPGLYFRPGPQVPEAYLHIGVRIEDDLVVTETGHENLTHAAPKTVVEIEAVMA